MYIIDKVFLEHPRNVHMSYMQHMYFSCSIGCYFCFGSSLLSPDISLAFLSPEIAKEWHPTLNGS